MKRRFYPESAQAATTGSPWIRNGPTQLRMSLAWLQRRRSDSGSDVSAVRISIEDGGGFGWAAHWRDWVSRVELRPAKARVFNGEDGVWKNLRASRTTYLPVNPDAPSMTIS